MMVMVMVCCLPVPGREGRLVPKGVQNLCSRLACCTCRLAMEQ